MVLDHYFPSHVGVLSTVVRGGGGGRGSDRMIVGFTTTYAIGAYHH
jgi:hypothetical protein